MLACERECGMMVGGTVKGGLGGREGEWRVRI